MVVFFFFREAIKSTDSDVVKKTGPLVTKATTSNLDCILDVNVKVGRGSSPEV